MSNIASTMHSSQSDRNHLLINNELINLDPVMAQGLRIMAAHCRLSIENTILDCISDVLCELGYLTEAEIELYPNLDERMALRLA